MKAGVRAQVSRVPITSGAFLERGGNTEGPDSAVAIVRTHRSRGVYLNTGMHEATAIACRPQVGVLLRAGDADAPHGPPGLVQLSVHRIDAGVVWAHGVSHVYGDPMLLGGRGGDAAIEYGPLLFTM